MGFLGLNQDMMTESEIRALRDRVFYKESTDVNWDFCRAKWMAQVDWLLEHDFPIEETLARRLELMERRGGRAGVL